MGLGVSVEGFDLERIKSTVDISAVIGKYMELHRVGSEYVGCCPFHKERTPSFSVVPNKGFFYCFGCGATGDVLDFLQKINNISLPKAAEMLGAGRVDPPPEYKRASYEAPPPRRITKAPPHEAVRNPPGTKMCREEEGTWVEVRLARSWKYTNELGELAFYVCRFERGVGEKRKKETPQFTYGSLDDGQSWRWGWGHFNEPRYLYNLYEITKKPNAPILIVEGEKAADAAAKLLPMYVVTTWSGGTNAVDKTDWMPLAGRKILIWPDNDQPGKDAAEEIATLIPNPQEIKILQPGESLDKGWDAADALESGWDSRLTVSWAKQHHRLWRPEEAAPDTEEIAQDEKPALRVIEGGKQDEPPEQDPECYVWGKPADPFRSMRAPDWNPEHFPKAIADFAFDEADRSGADGGSIAMAALVCCASVIDPSIRIAVKRHDTGWKEGARLWAIVVGDPSVKKTMAVSKAVEPVRRIGNKLMEEYAGKIRDYEREFETWTIEKKNAAKVGSIPPAAPEKPVLARTLVDDTTTEALAKILQDSPRGVLSYNDEMGNFFGSMDAYRGGGKGGASKDASFWLRCYNGESAMVDRVGRDTLYIPRLSVSLVGSMQPDALRRVNLPEDGLMQRFMVVMAKRGKEKDRPMNEQIVRAYYNLIYKLYNISPSQDFTLVRLTDEAQIYREAMFEKIDEMIESSKQISTSMCSAFGKYQGLWARLALVYHCIDCATRGVHPQGCAVTQDTAVKVNRLLMEYLRLHLMVFYMGDRIHKGTAIIEHARWIAGYVLAHGKDMRLLTNRNIMRAYKVWSSVPEWDQKRVMEMLESLDWIRPIKDKYIYKGQPTQWVVNPEVHNTFKEQAEREKNARRALKEQMAKLMRGPGDPPLEESEEA